MRAPDGGVSRRWWSCPCHERTARTERQLIVRAPEMREALGARHLPILEAQAGEAEAAHGGVIPAVRGHKDQAAGRGADAPAPSSAGSHVPNRGGLAAEVDWPGCRIFTPSTIHAVERG